MESRSSQSEREAYLLPSVFTPWQNHGPDLARHSTEFARSPAGDDNDDGISMRRRASSVFYTPESLNDVSPTIREPPSQSGMSYSGSAESAPVTNNASDSHSRQLEQQSILHSVRGGSSTLSATEQSTIPPVANVNARRSAAITPTHTAAESIPMSVMYNAMPSPGIMISEDDGDADDLSPQYPKANFGCYARRDVYIKRWSWLYVTLIALSLYSTGFSALWLVVSIFQPQYGRSVSTGYGVQLTPPTATLLATLAAKTIELSFVTVFVAVLGQVLTRRAFSRSSKGMTLAEMTMRNWVIQPGSLLTYWEGIPNAATTFLGALTLTATICALFYTTASDAMVSPKLKRQAWATRELQGLVKTSYGNPIHVGETCQIPLRGLDAEHAPIACLDVVFSGQSYHSFTAFMAEWDDIHQNKNSTTSQLSDRPTAKHNLYDNTTMDSSWIETEYGDISTNFNRYNRVVNNVTLAMPHPGVYAAATDPINGILQPSELLGLGEYSIRASVVSPVVNVMCANVKKDEIAPLIYTEWPNAQTENTTIPGQLIGKEGWWNDIPTASETNWLNKTVLDDFFRWGKKYGRLPPVFPLYPADFNILTHASSQYAESLYVLAKNTNLTDYTLCDLRSWVTPKCSTAFDLSGTSGGHMKAHCEDVSDPNAYWRTNPSPGPPEPSGDWRGLAKEWGLAINLNGGTQNNNASNARILTNLILSGNTTLDPRLPSMAEALAVLASSTIVVSSIDSTFFPGWTYPPGNNQIIPGGVYERFHAQVQTQQYTSAHTAAWQVIFYPILGLTFLLNALCLLYLVAGTDPSCLRASSRSPSSRVPPSPFSPLFPFPRGDVDEPTKGFPSSAIDSDGEEERQQQAGIYGGGSGGRGGGGGGMLKAARGLVTDYTEPQNLFALAVNSPPSRAIAGACGHGPDAREMAVPWRVGYVPGANHYYFEAAAGREPLHRHHHHHHHSRAASSSGADLLGHDYGPYGQSYKRLSSRRAWL
ncbi:hypothetical protein SAMD00023353_1102160 [Rosellinia necatrix]|uniref:Mcm2 3 5 family protein n=1 Tax=Rosellinia necatrix TaxID=77044 RepID=A0A1S7UNR7_ROSNE|nr:hypothetical protein SAMD00023353_1102160 [Rosellinia necatrix]